ncbi:MDR family MFS transporter [Actinotalea sp. K2]|uniref:MDR family MFS transporter n=1 Tax=Actinotalea sp. K2 TaxID=2939438 RepID=UPI00201758E7|nr:MDR family MFS transporter [Actinotalea sp. K2]MCL3860821.1 DHA2 family efflux MFS transporter permease subunit [Actinotalea sp. K2]
MSPRDRLAVGLMLFSTFVVILNETTMGVALPHLMADLDIVPSTAQWVTTSFMLTMAVVIPVTGFVIQRITTRATFLTAMSLFSVGTLVCAVAPTFPLLLSGRVVQAAGTAIMLPLLMTTVMTVTPVATRGRTMGNISVVISVAPALGPTISGLVLSALPWRWIFVLMLPVALGALVLGAVRMPNLTTPHHARVDLLSVALSAVGFGGIVYGLSHLGESAGDLVAAAAPIVVGAAALSLFVARQRRLQLTDSALLDLRTFTSPTFSVAVVLMAISMMSLFGTIILLPLYAQNVLGLTPLQTGLLLLPGGLLMGLAAPSVGRTYDRHGPRVLLVPGTVVVSAAAWSFAALDATSPAWQVLAGHVVLSGGLALMFTPLFTAALGSLTPRLYSHGSAMVGTVQQVAGAAGTALFITVLTAQSLRLADGGASEVAATAGGVHAAFVVGAVITLVAIPAAFLLRVRPGVPGVAAGH